jgi:chromosome segregation ATPase
MTFRSESNMSTNRLIGESDNLSQKYNQFKRNLNMAKGLGSGNIDVLVSSGDFENLLVDANSKNQNLLNELTSIKQEYNILLNNHDIEVKKLTDEYMLKMTKLQNELNKYKNECNSLSEKIGHYEERTNQAVTESDDNRVEMERLNKIISVLEIDLNLEASRLKEKQSKLEACQQEYNLLQTKHFELSLNFKKIQEDNRTIQAQLDIYDKERRELLDKYNSFNDDIQKSQNERLEIQEKKNKEKLKQFKKKIEELKTRNDELEEELKNDRKISMDTKISYSKIYSKMQDDMKFIKAEWEKKCKDDASDFERVITELEAKHSVEVENLKHDFQVELENKNREVNRHKQNSDLLKNFEKEFIRLEKHEEIITAAISDLKKKFNQDLQIKQEEYENEMKKRMQKIDEEKKAEYEFLTENTRKSLKQAEKANEQLRTQISELREKLTTEKENSEKLLNNINNLQKNIKTLEYDVDQKDVFIKGLSDKTINYEEDLKNFTQSSKHFQSNIENLRTKVEMLSRERDELINELRRKEENYFEETKKLEKQIKKIKEEENERFDKEHQSFINARTKAEEYENIIEQLQADNNYLINKNAEIEKNLLALEEAYDSVALQHKEKEATINELEKDNFEYAKTLKKINFEHKTTSDLIIKVLKSKLTTVRSEIESIKSYFQNELAILRKENGKLADAFFYKARQLSQNTDKQIETAIIKTKEQMESVHKAKLQECEAEMQSEITKVTQKFEKHIFEQLRIKEKLEKENKALMDQQQAINMKAKEGGFKIQEYEQEIKNLQTQLARFKADNDTLNESIEKLKQEKKKFKQEYEEMEESSKREAVKKLQTSLQNLLLLIVKIKGKYQQEIVSLKGEVENLTAIHKSIF